MPAKTKTVNIPSSLAQLLVAKKEDLKDPSQYEDIQNLAKSMLKLLMK